MHRMHRWLIGKKESIEFYSLTIAALLVSVMSLIVSISAVYFTREQARIAEEQLQLDIAQSESDFSAALTYLSSASPPMLKVQRVKGASRILDARLWTAFSLGRADATCYFVIGEVYDDRRITHSDSVVEFDPKVNLVELDTFVRELEREHIGLEFDSYTISFFLEITTNDPFGDRSPLYYLYSTQGGTLKLEGDSLFSLLNGVTRFSFPDARSSATEVRVSCNDK